MPQVVPYLTTIGKLVTFGMATGTTAAVIGGLVVIGTFSASRFLAPKINMNVNDNDRTRSATVRGTTEPQKRVYGETLVSGPITYAQVAGTFNRHLHQVIALAGHELTSIKKVFFDDQIIDLTDSNIYNATSKLVISGKFGPSNNENNQSENVVLIDTRLGAASQTPYATLRADTLTSQEYLATHRGNGIASIYVRLTIHEGSAELWDEVGNPRNIRALVEGAKVYDPRLEVAAGGTAGASPTNSSYKVFDVNTLGVGTSVNQFARNQQGKNPALIIADLLMDNDFGLGIASSKIDWASVISAADHCDQLVAVPSSETQKRFTASGVVFGSDTHRRSIEKILMSMDGDLLYSQGKYIIKAGAYEAPTESFTENDVVSAVEVKTSTPRQDRYNQVSGLFVDPDENYKLMEFGPVTVSGAIARDNGEVLPEEIKLPFTDNHFVAQRLAFKKVKQSFAQTMMQVTLNLKGMRVRVGDRINLTLPEFNTVDSGNWSPKVFKVIAWNFAEEGGGVDLTLVEDEAGFYDDPAESDYSTVDAQGQITTSLPDVAAPTNFVATSQINAIKLDWVNPPNAATWEQIWIFRSTNATTPTDSSTPITRLRTTSFIDQRDADGTEYYYWIQAVKYPNGSTPTSGNTNSAKSVMVALGTPTSGKIAATKIGQTVMDDDSVGSAQIIDGNVGSSQIATTIQSDNYSSSGGASGWQINRSGSAFFRTATITATIQGGSIQGLQPNGSSLTSIPTNIFTRTSSKNIPTGTESGAFMDLASGAFVFGNAATFLSFANNTDVTPNAFELDVKGVLSPTVLDLSAVTDVTVMPSTIKAQGYVPASIPPTALSDEVWNQIDGLIGQQGTGFYVSASGVYLGEAQKIINLGSTPDHRKGDITVQVVVADSFSADVDFAAGSDPLKLNITLQYKLASASDYSNAVTISTTSGGAAGAAQKPANPKQVLSGTVYSINESITVTLTSGAGQDIADDVDLDFRVILERVGSQSAFATVANGGANDTDGTPVTLQVSEGAAGIVATAGNAETLDNIDSTGFLRLGTSGSTVDNNAFGNQTFTGDITVTGNLTVQGTQTTLDTATLQVEDKNITLNYGTGDTSGSANGAGITIQDAVNSSTDATILWNTSSDEFDFSHGLTLANGKNLKITNTGSANGRLTLANTNSSYDWLAYHEDNGKVNITISGTGGAEFAFAGDNSNYTNATLTVGGADITKTKIGQWNTAYTYSQVGHLPLAGGTLSGTLNFTAVSNSRLISSQYGEVLWRDAQFGQDLIKQHFESGTGDHLQIRAGGNGSNVDHKLGESFADIGGFLKISGTTIISASRNLLNVVDATITGTATIPFVRVTGTGDASLSSTTHGIQVGATSGQNLIIDNNEVLSRNNGVASTLHLQADGGTVTVGAGTTANLIVYGPTNSGPIIATGTGTTNTTNALTVRRGNNADAFTVRDDGVVLVQQNYLYVNNAAGMYSLGAIRARGGITNDGNNPLSIDSGASHINFNSKNLESVGNVQATLYRVGTTTIIDASRNLINIGTISSGAITSSGVITTSANSAAAGINIRRANAGSGGAKGFLAFKDLNFKATASIFSIASGGDNNGDLRFATSNSANTSDPYNLTTALTLDNSQNATFTGTISSGEITAAGPVTAVDGGNRAELSHNGSLELTRSASNAFIDFKTTTSEDFDCRIQQDTNGLKFFTGGNGATATALTLDSSRNASFGGRLEASDGTSVKAAYGFSSSNTTGISYSSTNNRVNILSGGAVRAYVQTGSSNPIVHTMVVDGSMDVNGAIGWSGGSSALANVAYTYSQVGHLPLAGGSLTGSLSIGSNLTVSNGELSVTRTGDHFPTFELARTGGSTKTNQQWDQQIGSTGNWNLKAATGTVYYPIICTPIGDVNLASNTSGTSPVVSIDQSLARTTFAGSVRVNHSEDNGVKVTASDTNADQAFSAMRLDYDLSGSQTVTADRIHTGLFIDVDSSATGGDTSDEHRIYGIFSEVRASGDSDLIYGGNFHSRVDNFGTNNQVSNLRGVNAHAQPHHDAGHIPTTVGAVGYTQNLSSGTGSSQNNWGVYGLATAQSTSSYTSASYRGVYGLAQAQSNNVPNIAVMIGVAGEVQLDNRTLSSITINNAYVVSAIFDENDADDASYTLNNSYLFFGDYQGSNLATNQFGVFIADDVENRFAGRVRAKEFDVGGALVIDASRNLKNIVDGTFSGELLVGTTDSTVYNNSSGTGVVLGLDASIQAARANDAPLLLNRQGSDGSVAVFYKNGTSVGTVGVDSGDNLYITSTTANHAGLYLGINVYAPLRAGSLLDDAISFGNSTYRYKDLQLSGTAYAGELIIGQNSGLSGTQVYIKKKDNSTNLQRWGEGTSGASTYRFRIDQNFKFIANSGSGDNFTLHSDSGNLTGVGTIASGSIIATGTSSTNPVLETVSPTNGGAPIFRAGTEDFLGVLIGTQGGGFSVESNNYFAIWHQPYADRGSQNNLTLRAQIDNDGNFLIATSSPSTWTTTAGFVYRRASSLTITRSAGEVAHFNRLTSDGTILDFRRSGTSVGTIGSEGGDALVIQSGTTLGAGLLMHPTGGNINPARNGAKVDNAIDLGRSTHRFKDLYMSGSAFIGSTRLNAGSASAPSHSFFADFDTGMYRATTNQLGFATGGSEQVRISAGGLDLRGSSASLTIRRGNVSTGTTVKQIIFGYAGTTQFAQNIRTRHNSGAGAGNAIDFYLWDQANDVSTDHGSLRAVKIETGKGLDLVLPNGGYQINGTTVITSLRNLTNIGSISAAGPVTIALNASRHLKIDFDTEGDLRTSLRSVEGSANNLRPIQVEGQEIVLSTAAFNQTASVERLKISDSGAIQMGGTTIIDANRNATFTSLDIEPNGTIELKDQNGVKRGFFQAFSSAPHLRISTSGQEQIGIFDSTTENIRINGSGDFNLITGALEISGTTVLDQSRNLTNISSITASGVLQVTNSSGSNGTTTSQYAVIGLASGGAQATIGSQHNGDGYANLNLGSIVSGDRKMWHISKRLNSLSNRLEFFWYESGGFNSRFTFATNGKFTAHNDIQANEAVNAVSGFRVNGTTVIDSGRNLLSIGSISASTLTTSGDITVNGNQVFTSGSNARVKFAVWSNTTYGIGMTNGVSFGGIANNYAMTFQMNNDVGRGFVWLDHDDTLAQGAMALTTDGKLTVANATRIGFGKSDTTTPASSTAMLNVNGDILASGTVTLPFLRVTGTGDASLSSTTHGIQVGSTSGQNLLLDNNEVLSRNNGAASTLHLQADGGTVTVGAGSPANLTVSDDVTIGSSTANARLFIRKADNDVADHINIFCGTTQTGSIGSQDTTWLRINQTVNKNIYTPRYIRADSGFFVDNTATGLDGSGRLRAFAGSTSSVGIGFANDIDTGFYRPAANVIGIVAGGGERARFDSNGIELRSGKLLKASRADNTRDIRLFCDNDFGTLETTTDPIRIKSANAIRFDCAGNEHRMNLDTSGNLVVEGNVTAFGSPSDIRLKENIERIDAPIQKVQQLDGVTFQYKKTGAKSTGLIAQQLLEVLPEVVYEEVDLESGEKHFAVRYGQVVGLLVEAIKDQQKQIDSLTDIIKEMTNGNNEHD